MMALTLQPCDSSGTEDTTRHPVPVTDCSDPVYLGRNPLTGIVDKKLSRQHVEVVADFQKEQVTVKQLGSHSGVVSGEPLEKGDSKTVEDGEIFHLLKDKYAYRVSFCQENNNKGPSNSERKLSEETKTGDGDRTEEPPSGKRKASEMEEEGPSEKCDDKAKPQKKVRLESGWDDPGTTEPSVEDKLKALQENAKAELVSSKVGAKESRQERERGAVEKASKNAEVQRGAPTSEEQWGEHGKLVVYTTKGVRASSKIAGFDMDGTIITTSSGKVFPTDLNDWRIYLPEIPGKLKKLQAEGYKIVFFTNQLGISRGKMTLPDFKKKLLKILAKLGIPVQGMPVGLSIQQPLIPDATNQGIRHLGPDDLEQVLIATGTGIYRKPSLGMWDHFVDNMNDDIMVDMSASVFVGDAAGRPVNWMPKRKKDFSCSDRLFAMNIGLRFKTPEEYFQGKKAFPFSLPSFDPRKINTKQLLEPVVDLPSKSQEVLLLVGFPASGKSTFVRKHLIPHKYVHVNRDTMGSWQKCVAACEKSLKKGLSVVVDNTNPDVESRKRYTDCAKKNNVTCRCIVFNITMDQAKHNERFRSLTPAGKNHDKINDMIFNSYNKKFTQPKPEEGFSEIARVNFVPSFINSKEEKLYKMFLMEK